MRLPQGKIGDLTRLPGLVTERLKTPPCTAQPCPCRGPATHGAGMGSKLTQSLVEREHCSQPGKSVLYADTKMRGF